MSSIIEAILKAAFGILVNKGRDVAAKKLKDGDVADQELRTLVVRELDDIKFKIDGLARVHLLASVSFLKQGLVFLFQLLDHPELWEVTTATARAETAEKLTVSLPPASGGSKLSIKTSSLVEELKRLKLNELNETAKQLLADAKKSFEKARDEATRAFSNEGLQLSDRILATKIRIMAIIVEKVDNPSTALPLCRLFLEELHNIPAVQNCFEVEITKPFMKYRLYKKERHEIIAEVYYMNFVVYSVKNTVGRDWRGFFKLPLTIGKLKIDPLCDYRLNEALSEFSLEQCCLREWTFGQEGHRNHRLVKPIGITTNTQGQFIVADRVNVKVFDPSGMFLQSLCPLTKDKGVKLTFYLYGVATDGNDNLYVLASLNKKSGIPIAWRGVYVFDKHYNLHYKFLLKGGVWFFDWRFPQLTVSNDDKVLVLVDRGHFWEVEVYQTDGRFAYSFGQGKLPNVVRGLTTAHDRVMVLDGYNRCVQVYNTQGDHLHQFAVQGDTRYGAIAFHQPSEHVIVSSTNPDDEYHGQVSIYTKDGELVRSVELNKGEKKPRLSGLTVSVDGRVAVTNQSEYKVNIISF